MWCFILCICYLGLSGCTQDLEALNISPNQKNKENVPELRTQTVTRWGHRPSNCGDAEDWKSLPIFADISSKIFDRDPIPKSAELSSTVDNCFRVGNEILIKEASSENRVLARALVTKIRIFDNYSFVDVDILEVFHRQDFDSPGERIVNCDSRFEDWADFYLDTENKALDLESISSGRRALSVWNGSYNCFRVGSLITIGIRGDRNTNFGTLAVKRVATLRYEELDDATLLRSGKPVADQRERLEAQLSKGHGFVTFMEFDTVGEIATLEETPSSL